MGWIKMNGFASEFGIWNKNLKLNSLTDPFILKYLLFSRYTNRKKKKKNYISKNLRRQKERERVREREREIGCQLKFFTILVYITLCLLCHSHFTSCLPDLRHLKVPYPPLWTPVSSSHVFCVLFPILQLRVQKWLASSVSMSATFFSPRIQ